MNYSRLGLASLISVCLATEAGAAESSGPKTATEAPTLQLETKIALGEVAGRIDHMAVDLVRRRLFVAELGNGSVGVVGLDGSKEVRRLKGFREPQGVGYVARTDTLYVASAGDGSVRVFHGPALDEQQRIELGDDADNIRIAGDETQVIVGYGRGGLAVIDAETNRELADMALPAHPESFRLEEGGSRIFVNLPDAHAVAVVDRTTGRTLARWPTGALGGNFPMTLDRQRQRVLVVFRQPARLAAFSMQDGATVANAETCGDSDDVFFDEKHDRVYVSCGAGFLDVFAMKGPEYRRIDRIGTASGARTSLFVPELDRLFLAVRASAGEPAAIWVYRPTP
jgi:DNA-binding beta-propeller fold protein YncE